MSHTTKQLAAFREIADEISEAVDEKAYKVDVAMAVDDDFVSQQARAWLLRDVVLAAASKAASRGGVLDFRPVNGSGRELRLYIDMVDRRYRIRKATLVGDELRIRANSDSALSSTEPDELALIREEQWVLGWTIDPKGRIAEVFVAEVRGVTPDKPHWLILGPQTQLLEPRDPDDDERFTPSEPGLPGFDDDGASEADYGAGS